MESKILIVDDEKTVIQQVSALLKTFGYKSAFVPKPDLMFGRLETEPFDLVLLDINMPDIDGISLLRKLRASDNYKDLPVIMMTGDTHEETLEKCFEYGANDYITKPIQELVLKARVKSVIEKQMYLHQIDIQRKILEHTNKNLTQSIQYAASIQQAVLPSLSKLSALLPESFVLFKPREMVSGDFYWFDRDGDKLFIAAIDCTGHGVPGAFMSMLGHAYLTQIRNEGIIQPVEILERLNNLIQQGLRQAETDNRDGMDVSLCMIDTANKTLTFAGAHNELLIIKDNQFSVVEGTVRGVGGRLRYQKSEFEQQTINYDNQTMFYIYSDGYADQFGGDKGRKFMFKYLRNLLLDIHSLPIVQQKERLLDTHEHWRGVEHQIDDILVIGFRITE